MNFIWRRPGVPYSETTIAITMMVNLLSCFLGLVAILIVILQVVCLGRVIWMTTTNTLIRAVSLPIIIVLALLYCFNLIDMLSYSWGLPAFNQTIGTIGNSNGFCIYDFEDQWFTMFDKLMQ